MQPNNEFIFRIDGIPYLGWEEVSISRSIERMSGKFQISVSNLPEDWAGFPLSKSVSFELNKQIILNGYIDIIKPKYDASGSSIIIIGRDAVSDLLDCAATIDNDFETKGQKIENIISRILKPFNIELIIDTNTGGAFSTRIAVQPGETAFDFIERLCRIKSILPISNGVGGLVLTKPGVRKSAGTLEYGINILSADGIIDWSERYSEYIVKGMSEASVFSSQEEVSEPEGRAQDLAINRYRPKVIVSESQGYDLSLRERAIWQRNFDQARSRRVQYKVQGFFADNKNTLWKPNEIVSVRDPILKINRDMLIVSVDYEKSDNGSFSTLSLVLPESFDLPAEKQPQTNDPWGDL